MMIVVNFNVTIIQKIYDKFEEKKVGVAGLQPTLISLDYSKLLN